MYIYFLFIFLFNKTKWLSPIVNHIYTVYPELDNLKWTIWSKYKENKIKCQTDKDCLFPQACCHHPVLAFENNYCCTNWNKRKLKYAYILIR
jgi:hypothetical protein